jgi:hypothetical protein
MVILASVLHNHNRVIDRKKKFYFFSIHTQSMEGHGLMDLLSVLKQNITHNTSNAMVNYVI